MVFGVILVWGGSGKTLSIVEYLYLLKEKYPKLLILTNFDCFFADGKINSWRDLLEITNIQVDQISEKKYNKFRKYKVYNDNDLWLELNLDTMQIEYCVRRNHGVVFRF